MGGQQGHCFSKLFVTVVLCSRFLAGDGLSSLNAGSIRFDAKKHVAGKSSGCGNPSPYTPGQTTVARGTYDGVDWLYRIYVPQAYDPNVAWPLILQFPGWGVSAAVEEKGAGITQRADSLGYISVTPQGMNDNSHWGGPWYSWNAVGSTQSPGKAGPTCTSAASTQSYCYSSCPCQDSPQCDWTTCDEGITPTGTGTKDIGGFIPGLYNTLEAQLCIDTTREYAAGESNGGMMAYQVGVDMAKRLAAIFPQFGSFHRGFNLAPADPVPVMDLHGFHDTTVPANVSLAADGYYYTVTAEIFGGNEYSSGWMASNGCSGPESHYPTSWDGQDELYCVSMGECPGGDVVRCAWNGAHNWYGNSAYMNGGLVTEFLLKWAKPSHVGGGYSRGDKVRNVSILEDFTIISQQDLPTMLEVPESQSVTHTARSSPQSKALDDEHYGDPDKGCRDDEDVVVVGSGRACAPRIGNATSDANGSPPEPLCRIGGAGPSSNGCPAPGQLSDKSQAWPVCLGKSNATDGYDRGEFHCVLQCPCELVVGDDSKLCGPLADAHCPGRSRCERGELRNRACGLCTYSNPDDSQTVPDIIAI